MASRPASARLFVALDPPDDARLALAEWRDRVFGTDPALRLVAREALHVTLVFLGHLPEDEVDEVARLAQPPQIQAPLLTAAGVKPIPPRRPRLVALDLHDEGGRAGAIQAALSDAYERAGLYEPEKRPFWPHVTLARVRQGTKPSPPADDPPPAGSWRAEAVTLYRSRLSPKGARYEPLARVELAE